MEQKMGFHKCFWVLIVFLGIMLNNAGADQNVYLREGGNLNGQSVDAENYLIQVNPSGQITGKVNIRAFSDSPSSNVVPLAATVTWGDRENQHWLVTSHFSPGWHDLTVNVNKTAPMNPGLYYIIIAAEDTFTSAQIMSATAWNWSGGDVLWYDDNDLGWDWNNSHFYDARINGEIMATHLGGTGDYVLRPYGANWVAVYVTEPLISDDFESYDLNTWPLPGWIKNANASSDPTNNRVEMDPKNSENQALKLHGSIGGCWAALAFHQCSFPNEFTIECDVYNVSGTLTGCHPYHAQIGMRQGSSWTNPGRGLLVFGEDNNIIGGGSVLQTYETDRWYNVKICYQRDGSNLNLYFWIDGDFKGMVQEIIEDLPKELSFDHLNLTAQEGTVYFDNVVVYDSLLHLEVRSPNGGEELIAGSQYTITWDSLGDVGSVNIELYDGKDWALEGSNTANDGKYEWFVPEVTSNQCLVRISDTNDPNIYDVSDNVFTIFECLGPIPGDLNNDCYTNGKDLAILTAHWLRCGNPLDPACSFVAYWSFDDPCDPGYDDSGNEYDGTIYGAESTNGIYGNALSFDGVDSYVDTIPQADIPSTITVSMWIYPTFLPGDSGQIWGSLENASGGKDGYVANYYADGGYVKFAYYLDNIHRGVVVTANNTVPLNTWSYLTFTVDSLNNAQVCVNGVKQESGSFTVSPTSHDRTLMIGKSIRSQNLAFDGKIDEVRIYNRALTGTEMEYLYNAK